MMTHRRTPRAHLDSAAIGEDTAERPPVAPMLVEWLEKQFPITLSDARSGFHNVIEDQAEQRGRQQVIERLRSISQNQE